MTDVSVIHAVPATRAKKKFSKVALLKALKFALPVAALAAFFPDTVLASTAGKDLMSSGDATVKEGANKRGNSSRLTQSFHFFMFEPIFSPVNALNQPI